MVLDFARACRISLLQLFTPTRLAEMPHREGDKVRVKGPSAESTRGVVVRVEGKQLVVQLEGGEGLLVVPATGVTNFSLAARKAWASAPARPVGRKKKMTPSDRVSVTLRIDRDLWQVFQELEEAGEIEDRTATINGWFREKLGELNRKGRRQDAQEGE